MNNVFFHKVGYIRNVQPNYIQIITMQGAEFIFRITDKIYDKIKNVSKDTITSVVYNNKFEVYKILKAIDVDELDDQYIIAHGLFKTLYAMGDK